METNQQIQAFCRRYFHAVDAPVLVDQPDFLQVELPREIDKELTDRPFYWMYVEATGQEVPHSVLSLSFAPDLEIAGVEKMEFVTLGSFRLNKIIESAQKRGRFTLAYQVSQVMPGSKLIPFLLTTFKLAFVADRRRDEMLSFAINLQTGDVIRDFYEQVESLSFAEQPENFVSIAKPLWTPADGYAKLRETLMREIQDRDHQWAFDAEHHLERELEQLETYYQSLRLVNNEEQKTDEEREKKAAMYAAERELRIAELKWRCAPRIQVTPFHFAILYCAMGVPGSTTTGTSNRLSI